MTIAVSLLWLGLCACQLDTVTPESGQAVREIETQPWGEPDVVLAEVNGRPITRGEFYLRVLRRFGTWKLITGMIKEELFFQEAERLGLKVSDEERDLKVEEIFRSRVEQFPGGLEEMARIYQREGLSLSAVRRDLEREVATQLLVGKVTRTLRDLDEDELREYYNQTSRHRRFETRHIAYSYLARPGQEGVDPAKLKADARQKALRAAERVRAGADFEALARAESDDEVTAAGGGRLGAVHEESPMDPALKRAIFSLKEGEVSEPVENVKGGYHVFQVVRILGSESFVDCREKLKSELMAREPDLEEIERTLELLRGRADIHVFGYPLTTPPGSGRLEDVGGGADG